MTTYLQPIATGLAGLAAIAAFIWSLVRDRHTLTLVERLSSVSGDVTSPSVRRLVEDYRDERAVAWILLQRAPRETGLQLSAIGLQVLGGLAFAVWLTSSILVPAWGGRWVSYLVTLVLFVGAGGLAYLRRSRRDGWMDQERQWRNLAQDDKARRADRS